MASYIEERVGRARGEQIRYLTTLSVWAFTPAYVLAALCFGLSVAITALLPESALPEPYAAVVTLAPAVVGVVVLTRAMIVFYTTEIGLTNRRVMLKTGWVARATPEIALDKIEMRELQQTALGRMAGFGTVHVRAAGDENLILKHVDDPITLIDRLTREIEHRAVAPGRPAAAELA